MMTSIGWLVCSLLSAQASNYQNIVDKLQAIEVSHSTVAKTFSIGRNDDGNDIAAIRVSVSPLEANPAKVAHLIVATHHGNETKAPYLALQFLENLVSRFESDEILRGNLGDTEWTIVPVLNISGFNTNSRYEHGLDPNRDYPGPCNPASGGRLGSIRTLMNHMASRIYAGTITIHGYIGTLTYPWGVDVDNTHTLDHNLFESATAKAAQINHYRYGTSTDIVYPALGTYEDYAYWKHGLWSLLVELESGSNSDLRYTANALAVYFDAIDSSPSVNNQLTGNCIRSGRIDLQNE